MACGAGAASAGAVDLRREVLGSSVAMFAPCGGWRCKFGATHQNHVSDLAPIQFPESSLLTAQRWTSQCSSIC
eukprot:4849464-Prymnesium_polylepis.1